MNIGLELMGFDFIADVDYRVTSWGSCDSWYEPGDPMELEIDSIVLYRDEPLSAEQHKAFNRGERFAPGFEATGELFNVLCEKLESQIYEKANEEGPDDGPDPDWEYDRMRDERMGI
jgi:hypothetical protein